MEDGFLVTRVVRMSVIRAYIQTRIGDPALCLADVAAHAQISTSYVRKLFAAEGAKFSAHVLETRLEMVARALTDPATRGAPVSAIASACGFNDVSYFNRAFRKRYGCTPSDWRSCGPAPDSASAYDGEEAKASGQP